MPPRSQTLPDGIQRLSKLIAHLNSAPKLSLQGVKNLRICLAAKNDHFGVRNFVREELPRIRYANPDIGIEVKRALSTKEAPFRATMDIELEDGRKKELDLQEKWSSLILQELMDTAGGDPWKRYKAAAKVDNLPVVPGESEKVAQTRKAATSSAKKNLPTLDEWQKIQDKLEEAKSKQPKEAKDDTASKSAPETKVKAKQAKKETTSKSAPEAKANDKKEKQAKKDNASDSAQKAPSS